MPRQPIVSAAELIKALEQLGFSKTSQRGSHVKMHHDASGRTTIVPMHKEIKPGTLKKGILNPLQISVQELIAALKQR